MKSKNERGQSDHAHQNPERVWNAYLLLPANIMAVGDKQHVSITCPFRPFRKNLRLRPRSVYGVRLNHIVVRRQCGVGVIWGGLSRLSCRRNLPRPQQGLKTSARCPDYS